MNKVDFDIHLFSPLITTVENGDSKDKSPVKKMNGLVEGTSFDQILDLGSVEDSLDTNKSQTEIPSPIMAFEESIQQQNNNTTAGTATYLIILDTIVRRALGQMLKELVSLGIRELPNL